MNLIITGGAGFIGSHLVDKLVNENYQITVIDNLSTGSEENIKKNKQKIKFIKHDFAKPASDKISRQIKENVDVIIHLAALPRIGRSIKNPIETHQANVTGVLNALEMARTLGVKKFIYSSSSSVYGTHPRQDLPLSEDATKNPMNPYAVQKLMGEEYCQIYSKIFNINICCLRLFNVYGPKMPTQGAYKLIFGNWITQIKSGQKLTIYGDGKQTRDFTYIDDAINAFALSIRNIREKYTTFNVCSGKEISINELAELFTWPVEYLKNPRPQEERYKQGSFEKIKISLGWSPKVSLEEGIERFKKEHHI